MLLIQSEEKQQAIINALKQMVHCVGAPEWHNQLPEQEGVPKLFLDFLEGNLPSLSQARKTNGFSAIFQEKDALDRCFVTPANL